MEEKIAYINNGSLKGGLSARVITNAVVREGSFVVAEDRGTNYYGLVTDIRLSDADSRYTEDRLYKLVSATYANLVANKTLYQEIDIMPALMQKIGEEGTLITDADPNPIPVNTLPPHRTPVRLAGAFDVAAIFGKPEDKGNFVIGYTREQNHPVALNMKKLTERSAGVFGATGSGKSYLTRMLLAGLISEKQASVLVFDMHSEYAYGDISSDTHIKAKGLCELFGKSSVQVCALGTNTTIKGNRPDFDLVLKYSDITTQDILMLSKELNLRDTSSATLFALEAEFKENWLQQFMEMDVAALQTWCNKNNISSQAAEALQTKLNRLYSRDYLKERSPEDTVKSLIDHLRNNISIVMSFGNYDSDLDYLLVSNLLTRKIREVWENDTEAHYKGEAEPHPLVIAVEEAHKLLNPEMASQTSFGLIAREMRKYFVTLLVIDQRPSQIYDDIMSQLGTRITAWLGDENDIAAVLSGLSGKDALRGMLSRLQPKQEVLILGYGVPMPIPLASRRYDEVFYKSVKTNTVKLPEIPDDNEKDWLSY